MTTKKLYSLLLFITIFLFNNVYAINIENKCPSLEEMWLKKLEFIIQKAELSSQETEAVKPIFLKYENKMWQLHKKCRLDKSLKTALNYEELNDNYIQQEIKRAEYLKEYHSELKKVLTPEKLFNYYRAEKEYKRYLINEMKDHRHRGYHGKGKISLNSINYFPCQYP